MGKRFYRVLAMLLAVFWISLLAVPAFATENSESEYVSQDTFWNWLSGNTSGILHTVIGYTFGSVCTQSEDGYHRSSSALGHVTNILGQESPYYECICDACGATFTAYETDLQQSYDKQVADLPAPVYGSDGSIYVIPSFEIQHYDASTIVAKLSNGGTKENSTYRCSVNLPLISFEMLERSYESRSSCSYTVDLCADIPFLCSAELLFSSLTYSTNTQSGQLTFYSSGSSFYKGGVKDYQAGSRFCARLQTSALFFIKDGSYILAGNYILFSLSDLRLKLTPYATLGDAVYNMTTRPTSITGGNYGIIGDNGQITTVTNNNQIVNETNNTYYNPATGETSTIIDWSYDYSDRSYNLTLEGGDTSTVTYGDENITITETTINESGDTIINNYTIYYIIDGSGTGTGPDNPPSACEHDWQTSNGTLPTCTRPGSAVSVCSKCQQTKTETIPALGHNWQVKQTVTTQYDDTGQLVQQGYTIFECSNCHEQYKSQDGTIPPGSSGNNSGDEGEEKEGFLSWLLRKAGELLGAVGNGIISFLQSVLDGIFDGLISLVNSVFENLAQLVDLFGSFGDALGVLWTWLPPEIMVILVAGVSVFVLIALLKLFMK